MFYTLKKQCDSTALHTGESDTYFVLEENDELGAKDETTQLRWLKERMKRETEKRCLIMHTIFLPTFAIAFL